MQIRLPKWLPHSMIAVLTVTGMLWLADYTHRPGRDGKAIQDLTQVKSLPFRPSAASLGTLLFFFHPRCPCTAATLRGLESVVDGRPAGIQVQAVVFCPEGQDRSWIDSSTTQTATRIFDSKVLADFDARTIREFGVRTSGHVLYYDGNGKLLFSGGITPGRGHEGDCPAISELREKIAGRNTVFCQWPVFGCPLYSAETEAK